MELWGLRCFPLTAAQPATSLGKVYRFRILSGLMPRMTGAASLATAGVTMCSSGWSRLREAEGTAAAESLRPPPAAAEMSCQFSSRAFAMQGVAIVSTNRCGMDLNMVKLASSCQEGSQQVGTDIQNSTAMSVDNSLKQCCPASRQHTARCIMPLKTVHSMTEQRCRHTYVADTQAQTKGSILQMPGAFDAP